MGNIGRQRASKCVHMGHGLHEYGGYWAEGSRALQGTTGHYRALQGVKIETLTGQSRAVFGRTEKWVLALPAGLFY